MDAVALAAAKADAKKRVSASARNTSSIFRGMVPVTQRGYNPGAGTLSNGTDTSGMYRVCHKVNTSCADVRLVYTNFYGAQASVLGDGPNAITVKVTIDPPQAAPAAGMAASVYRVTFGGVSSVTIQPGGIAVSDPVPVTATAGQYLYENCYVSVASAGMKWPTGSNTLPNGLGVAIVPNYYEGGASGAPTTDTTAGGSTPPTGYVAGYWATAIIGNPQSGVTAPPTIYTSGDSILAGYHDYTNFFDGWLGRACAAAGISYLNVAHPGEQAAQVQVPNFQQRLPLAAACTVAVDNYGRNDLAVITGISLATFQGYVIALWRQKTARGLRSYHCTLTPISSSTDNFFTTANQTVVNTNSYQTNRVAFNAWLRDGAPLTPTTFAPVATGTASSGTVVRSGSASHPLTGYIEIADLVETARDSGIWKQGRVVTDAAFTSGSRVFTSATANFTSADVGASVYVPGVGYAHIASVQSATQATYETANTAPSTVTNQTIGIGYWTDDGTHPTTSAHIAIAAIVNPATL